MGDRIGKIYIGNSRIAPLLLNKVGKDVPATGFLVQVIDYDGTILKSERLNTGDTFTLPSQPSHTGLTFQSWSSPVTITNNAVTVTDQDITIGATYITTSGLSEFDITLTEVTGLTVTLNINGTKNWGDGTSNTSTSHTYANVGDYTITCNGSTMTTSSSSGLFGQTGSNNNYYVKDIRFGSSITSIGNSAFLNCYSLTNITLPSTVTSIDIGAFWNCYSLKSITIPSSITSISNSAFYHCYSLTNVTLPSSVTSIGNQAFSGCYSLKNITIPSSVTSINSGAIAGCSSLTSIIIPEGVTSIGSNAFNSCYSLTNITIPSTVTSIGNQAFRYCYSLTNITIPEGVTSISDNAFYYCYSLTSITIPSSLTSISSGAFYYCYSILEYDFSNHIAVPTLSSTTAFNGINAECKIYVPFSLYESWKVATNWSTYSDYIAVKNPATLNFVVTPNNSLIYVNNSQIQGTSTSWIGSTAPYVVHDSTNNVVLTGTQTGITEGAIVNITADLTTSSKITLSTGITGLTAKFTVGGLTFNATDEGSGNYSINVVGSGDTISYSVKGEGYSTATGNITTTGSNIIEEVTMEPLTEEPWTRPNLTDNGIMGGGDFAVCCTNPNFNEQAWMAVDDVTQDGYQTEWYDFIEESPDYEFYNPNPLKVTELKFVLGYRMSEGLSIYGSEDGSNWEEITSSYNPEPVWDEEIGMSYTICTLTNDNFYNYYKIVFEGQGVVTIRDLQITATQLA